MKYTYLLFFVIVYLGPAQVLAQTENASVLNRIYNFEFSEAKSQLLLLQKEGKDPISNRLMEAFLLRWEYIPIYQNEVQGLKFEKLLELVVDDSEKRLLKSPQSTIDLYHLISASLFLSEYHASKENYVKALYYGNKLYPYLLKTFEMDNQQPEFLFVQGLYLYYIEKYKEKNFFFKSMLWAFKSGDRGLGIALLKTSAALESPSKTEAIMFLSHVYLRHENIPTESLYYARKLVDLYPKNIKYRELLVESLVANKLWAEAEEFNKLILTQKENYFRLGGEVFQALILEKNGRFAEAKIQYQEAMVINQAQNKPNLHFQGICLLGLSRIASHSGKTQLGEEYYQKAKEIAPYGYIFENHFE